MVDLNSVFFHGLEPLQARNRVKNALEKLECIFQSGAILSRNGQLSFFDMQTHEFMKNYNKADVNWNGTDYISICKKRSGLYCDANSLAFNNYITGNNAIGIALSNSVLNLADSNRYLLMDGELQVKDSIPLEYMVGIVFGGRSLKEINDYVSAGESGDITQEDFKDHFSQDLVEKQDEIVGSIRDLLFKYGYENIPIYSSRDGFEIENVQDVIDEMGL